jgi:hypothetical protein
MAADEAQDKAAQGDGKKEKKELSPATKGGCAAVFGLLLLIGWLAEHSGCDTPVEVVDGVPTVMVTLTTYDSLKGAAQQVAKAIYKTATQHAVAPQVVAVVRIRGSDLTDQYGKTVEGDPQMGRITVTDVAEVRKYETAEAYAYNSVVGMRYMAEIRQMKHARMLSD